MKKFDNLPAEEKAEAIGKITGNVMMTILGAKGMSSAIKSGKLRLKFKVLEETPTIKTPEVYKTSTQINNRNSIQAPKKRPKNTKNIDEAKPSKKTITDIDQVKDWSDLESFIDTIDHVRFKEGLTGKVIQEMINEVRQWTRNIKDIPNYGAIRETVDKLKRNGGIMPETTGLKKVIQSTGEKIGKWVEKIQDIIPFKEAQKFLHKNILTWYDIIDAHITKLRTLTNTKIEDLGSGLVKIWHLKEMKEWVNTILTSVQGISFPWKDLLIDNLTILRFHITEMKEVIEKIDNTIIKVSTRKGNLTKKEFQALRFEEGFAVREIKQNGKLSYEYRDAKGRKVFEEYTYASHFKDGEAAVVKIVDGKEVNYIINREGKIISEQTEASFGSIQRFSDGKYKSFDGKYYRIKDSKGKSSREYTFMTEIQCDMVIVVDKAQWVKYIINKNWDRFKTPFHYIDDFTEDWVAAVKESSNGKWLLIDTRGNILRKDGTILRKNEDIVSKDKKGNFINGKGKNKTPKDKQIQEKEFEMEWYRDNLGALKAHTDMLYKLNNPDTIRKIEAKALALLKKNNIDIKNPALSHTKQEGILLFEDPIKWTRIINIEKWTVSKEAFSYIHTPDINNGFIRVSPLNDTNHMGVIDLSGKYIVQPKYVDVQIHNDKTRLFKVFEMREIGEKLKDGTIIQRHFSDPEGAQHIKRIGLTNWKGDVIIETGYTEITQSNDIMAQGLIRGENYEILHKSRNYNIEKYAFDTTNVASSSSEMITTIALLATEWPVIAEKAGKWSLNILRNQTSTAISELKNNELSLLINGTLKVEQSLSFQIQHFLRKKVPTIRDTWILEMEVEKIVHEQSKETIKKISRKKWAQETNKIRKNRGYKLWKRNEREAHTSNLYTSTKRASGFQKYEIK